MLLVEIFFAALVGVVLACALFYWGEKGRGGERALQLFGLGFFVSCLLAILALFGVGLFWSSGYPLKEYFSLFCILVGSISYLVTSRILTSR